MGVIHVLKIVRMVLNRAKHHHRRYEKSKLRKHNNAMSLYFSLDQVRVLPSSLTLHSKVTRCDPFAQETKTDPK